MTVLWHAAVLSGWLCTVFALLLLAEARAILGPSIGLLALVVSTGLLWPRWAPATTAGAALIAAGLWLWLERETGNPAAVLAIVTGLAGATWLSRGLHLRVRDQVLALRERRRQVDGLSREGASGVLKPEWGREVLAEEVERSRRYQHNLTVLRVGLKDPDEWIQVHGSAQHASLDQALGQVLRENLRTLDSVVREAAAEYSVILPEAGISPARRLAHRLALTVNQRLETEVRVGVVHFPTNAQSADELLSEAAAALEFARKADLLVAAHE